LSAEPQWPEGYGRIVLPEIDSTNAEAARRAASLDQPTWILALRQTAGRGRRGRAWHDPGGNFAATLLLWPTEPPGDVALRSFVSALALHDALVGLTGRPEALSLKWPNDVLLNGAKLAGILLEGTGQGRATRQLAIGIGVNLRTAPPPGNEGLRPVSLLDFGIDVAPETLLTYLAAAYAKRENTLLSQGFGPIRAAWLARAARLGTRIVARAGGSETVGIFETIDEAGALILGTDTGRRTIAAADVFFS
jgi:BirA family biotin operon repressor/biotin-[acetyl-CoA-carboxylase] ligase